MAIKYGFFDSVDGDRTYTAEDIGRYLHGLVTSGVYAERPSSLQVVANGDLTVTVQPGRAMLDYHYLENDDLLTLTLDPGDTMDRIDAVVMRLDLDARLCDIIVKKGTPATTPTRPILYRTGNSREYMLAAVYVPKLATAIAPSNITDTRPDVSVCGWVTGLIDQGVIGVPLPSILDKGKAPVVNGDASGYELKALALADHTHRDYAPTGYGLGGNVSRVLPDLDTPGTDLNTGWYMVSSSTANKPAGVELGIAEVMRKSSASRNDIIVVLYAFSPASTVYRRYIGDKWTEWEYLTPLMNVGVEYRTPERYKGRAVYTKLVSFGSLPQSGAKYVEHGISNMEWLVGASATIGNDTEELDLLCVSDAMLTVGETSVGIYMPAAHPYTETRSVTLKYTKTS